MYKKVFYIMVEDDLFPFCSIDIQEDDTKSEDSLQQTLLTGLSSDPVVVELQGIIPALGAQWDGSSFDNFIDGTIDADMKNYSLVVNERHFQYFGVNLSSDNGEMIAAALSSNPKIIGRISTR